MTDTHPTMRAVRWHGRRDVRVDQIPEPDLSAHEALLAVEWVGLCGTDLHEYVSGPHELPQTAHHPLTGARTPLTLGHEIVATVVRPASDGTGPSEGTRVIPDTMLGCGTCWWCRRHQAGLCVNGAVVGLHCNGGLADRMASRAATLLPVPDGLPSDHAVLAEPLSVAVRAVSKLPSILGTSVLVQGGGTIGQLLVRVLRDAGARHIVLTDTAGWKRTLALRSGATAALAPEELNDHILPMSEPGLDAAIDATGVPSLIGQAMKLVRRGGTVVAVGIHDELEPIVLRDAIVGEKTLRGSAGHVWDSDVATAVALIANRRIDVADLITSRIRMNDIVTDGFEDLLANPDSHMKVLVRP